jgi:hypothetical protein
MANWKTAIDIKGLHEDYKAGIITIQQVAGGLALRLKANKYFYEFDREIEELEDLAQDNETHKDELVEWYDTILRSIYDFGDFNHRIWIKTC